MVEFKLHDGRLACIDANAIVAFVAASKSETEEFGSKCHIYLANNPAPFSSSYSYTQMKKLIEAALTK